MDGLGKSFAAVPSPLKVDPNLKPSPFNKPSDVSVGFPGSSARLLSVSILESREASGLGFPNTLPPTPPP